MKIPVCYLYVVAFPILTGVAGSILFNQDVISPDRQSVRSGQSAHGKQEAQVISYPDPLALQSKTNANKHTGDDQRQSYFIDTMDLVGSADDKERVEGVEQLVAYPGMESEIILTQLLLTDSNFEVRNAAALSLVSVKKPLDTTIHCLISALSDESKDVRFSALSTLQDYMLRQGDNLEYNNTIRSELTYRSENTRFPVDTRNVIKRMLE